MALVVEELVGALTAPELVVRIQGSACLADALQGITRARLANPRRFHFVERSGPAVTVWENPTVRVTVTEREGVAEYPLDTVDDELFVIEKEVLT
jgi:hypothetical protein